VAETTTEKSAAKTQDQAPEARPGWRESVESLLVTIILALFATCFVVQAFKIPSPSMEPTLLVGDHLLVNKFIFEGNNAWYDRFLPYRAIRHGDVIVFKFPFQDHPHYVKRVIGLPGDRIKLINSVVYRNGVALKEPYAVHDAAAYDPFAENFPPSDQDYLDAAVLPQWKQEMPRYLDAAGEIVVPPGHFFVMGDNRDHSWDSRYWGFVPRDAIMGRPVVIYWSLKEPDDSEYDTTTTSSRNWMFSLIDSLLRLPVETRWHRMLKEVH
jgi:signal peptidase I